MPEGPEIKRAADTLADILIGQQTPLVECAFPALKPAMRRFSGERIVDVSPRGKALLTSFSNHETIYSHNQLYGEWQIYARNDHEFVHPTKQIRLVIHTEHHAAVLYSASDISVLPTHAISTHPYIAKLGVELLAPTTTVDDVLNQINQPRFAKKSLAGLLLDQGFLAGLGNYLRSEILFVAKLAITARIADLSAAKRLSIATTAYTLTHQSYQTHGITNDLRIAQRLKEEGLSFARYRHWVFDRAGEACHVCKATIQRTDVGGRGVYFCSHCQR
jgi:endonuclease VIII